MLRRAPRERLYGERRIARAAGSHERRPKDPEIWRLMREAPWIGNARFGIVSHTSSTEGMSADPWRRRSLHKNIRSPCFPIPLL